MRILIFVEHVCKSEYVRQSRRLIGHFRVVCLKSSNEVLYLLTMWYMSTYEQPVLLHFMRKVKLQLTMNNLAERKQSDELNYCRKTGKYNPIF